MAPVETASSNLGGLAGSVVLGWGSESLVVGADSGDGVGAAHLLLGWVSLGLSLVHLLVVTLLVLVHVGVLVGVHVVVALLVVHVLVHVLVGVHVVVTLVVLVLVHVVLVLVVVGLVVVGVVSVLVHWLVVHFLWAFIK